MPELRVYADTSVFGGTCDEEFDGPSLRFFARVRTGRCVLLVSRITLAELEGAPDAVKECLRDLPKDRIEDVPPSSEAEELSAA